MRKLTSLFLGCLMITCAFSSCRDKDDDGSGKSCKKKRNSDPIVGTWEVDDGGVGRFTFSEDGKLSMSEYWNHYIFMDDGRCFIGDSDATEYLDFDGSNFIITKDGTELLNMKKTKKTDADDFDGEYEIISGNGDIIEDDWGEGDFDMSITFDGDKSFMNIKDFADYEIDGDKIMLSNLPEGIINNEETTWEWEFELDDGLLTLTDIEGDTFELTKIE